MSATSGLVTQCLITLWGAVKTLSILDLAKIAYPTFSWSNHHALVANELYQVGIGNTDRLLLAQPPQTSKSTLVQIFVAWYLMQFPTRNVILSSYEAGLAEAHSERAMNIVREWGWLTSVFLGKRQSVSRWLTSEGGQVCAGSLGGGITGRPSDLYIVDDPVKSDETANSPIMRDKLLREYNACVETRLSPKGAIVLIQTRWHPHDLAGQVMNLAEHGGKQWRTITLPALALDNDVLGRAPGTSLWEDRYPTQFYEQRKLQYELQGMEYLWQALYQQQPVSGNKALEFPPHYFPDSMWIDARPEQTPRLRVLCTDPSKGADGSQPGDYQAHVLMDVMPDGTCVVESWLNRETIDQMLETILRLWQQYHPIAVGIEAGAGQAVYGEVLITKAKQFTEQIFPYHAMTPKIPKECRIRQQISPILAQKRLKLLKSRSNQQLCEQLRYFPTHQYDDGADGLAMCCELASYLLFGRKRAEDLRLIP